MSLSSNSLFHFTNSLDTVRLILTDKFYGSFCKEVLHYKDETAPLIIPMISFCDIPLKTISRYNKYGKYGLGLKKEWAIKNRLNPVLYLEKNSSLAESLIKSIYASFSMLSFTEPYLTQIKNRINSVTKNKSYNAISKRQELQKLQKELNKHDNMANNMRHVIYSIFYTKHYSDDLERNGQIIKDYRFYDEREWRFLPEFQCAVCELRRTEDEYKEWRGDTSKSKSILPEVNLSFSFADIEHIIIEKNDEAKEVREIIKSIAENKCPQEAKEELYSKIISFENIEHDL